MTKESHLRLIFLFLASSALISCSSEMPAAKASLSEADYVAAIIEIDYEDYLRKTSAQDSFVLYVYSPSCLICQRFSPFLKQGTEELSFTAYSLPRNEFSTDSPLYAYAQYTPAVIVYSTGSVIANLNSTLDSDSPYFESSAGFETWISEHVSFPSD